MSEDAEDEHIESACVFPYEEYISFNKIISVHHFTICFTPIFSTLFSGVIVFELHSRFYSVLFLWNFFTFLASPGQMPTGPRGWTLDPSSTVSRGSQVIFPGVGSLSGDRSHIRSLPMLAHAIEAVVVVEIGVVCVA